ncbi:hypothetical protein [Helicobacter turcicus]|uniref:Plasmid replication protein RepL domain-containing protein n=1 Tax=Helicobacter turcicus TaxID=2867412 RepID=A0ABS7JQ89_9HELI|nr:hypothetical protein [Helicobacter turcicus]MBX7491569.1 hypothetical protein [Helicobacter turcicus]MBX7546418.1 hypothetical protein [Helicobacter turcicus]
MKQEVLFNNELDTKANSGEVVENLFSQTGAYVNFGEVDVRKGHLVKKIKSQKQDDFVKLFADSVYVISNLTGSEIKVFWSLLMMMNYKNIIILSSDLRKRMSAILGVTHSAITQNLQSLIKKNIIVHLDPEVMTNEARAEFNIFPCDKKAYLVNPDIVGRGSFRDLAKIRQIIVKEWDFDKFEYIETLNNQFEYNGLNEVLKKP